MRTKTAVHVKRPGPLDWNPAWSSPWRLRSAEVPATLLALLFALPLASEMVLQQIPCPLDPIGEGVITGIASVNGVSQQACFTIAPPPVKPPFNLYQALAQGQGIYISQLPNGKVKLIANAAEVPFLGLQNTYSGAFNDFSASQIFLPGSRGAPQPNCVQALEGTAWYTPGSATFGGVFQVCQNQSGVFAWVTH